MRAWCLVTFVFFGCSSAEATGGPDAGMLGAPGDTTRTLAGWPDRSYDLHVPPTYDGRTALPVVLAFHGGGGNRASQRKLSCPTGATTEPGCLDARADARGFIVVYPDGTGVPTLAPDTRTWNAGGGTGGWQCVSGYACNHAVDDVQYVRDLLTDLRTAVHVGKVFATGMSNGAALAHRLACELPGQLAGIAPVGGENQVQAATSTSCAGPVPVLDIHGTADPCWPWAGGAVSCLDGNPGAKVSVADSLAAWRARNGCDPIPSDTPVPDTANDGTTTVHHVWHCTGASVESFEVTGGGHTWPGGYGYFPVGTIGLTSRDFSANDAMLDFFAAHR